MKSPTEQLEYLQWSAIDKITKIVELDVPFEAQHAAIRLIRNHLESRAQQTATPFAPPASVVLEDELPLDPALAALLG